MPLQAAVRRLTLLPVNIFFVNGVQVVDTGSRGGASD